MPKGLFSERAVDLFKRAEKAQLDKGDTLALAAAILNLVDLKQGDSFKFVNLLSEHNWSYLNDYFSE